MLKYFKLLSSQMHAERAKAPECAGGEHCSRAGENWVRSCSSPAWCAREQLHAEWAWALDKREEYSWACKDRELHARFHQDIENLIFPPHTSHNMQSSDSLFVLSGWFQYLGFLMCTSEIENFTSCSQFAFYFLLDVWKSFFVKV
jgi:hypothetical protein